MKGHAHWCRDSRWVLLWAQKSRWRRIFAKNTNAVSAEGIWLLDEAKLGSDKMMRGYVLDGRHAGDIGDDSERWIEWKNKKPVCWIEEWRCEGAMWMPGEGYGTSGDQEISCVWARDLLIPSWGWNLAPGLWSLQIWFYPSVSTICVSTICRLEFMLASYIDNIIS